MRAKNLIMKSYIFDQYHKKLTPELQKKFGIKNPMAIPRLVKIVINCGLGEALTDKKVMEKMVAQLLVICGQKPVVTKAKKAISSFKLREEDPIGLKVTLRKKRMWDFFTRLIGVALPRVHDFRGVPKKGFDGKGNYTLGLAEQTIFPELDFDLVDKVRGFEVTFVTTARSNDEGKALLEGLGIPFEK
jgi:large subunit ribosomal protein L5